MTTYRFRELTEEQVANWHEMNETNRRKALLRASGMDDESDTDDYCDGIEPDCTTCGGEGAVDNVAQSSGRWGWDTDGPGDCPNCGGSGLRKDQKTF